VDAVTAAPTALANVVLHVSDPDAALTVYRDALGLVVRFDSGWGSPAPMLALTGTDAAERMRVIAFEAEGVRLSLCSFGRPASPRPFEDSGQAHVAFRVPDLDAALARLEAAGATRLGEPGVVGPAHDRVRIGFVRDPDGVVLELIEAVAS